MVRRELTYSVCHIEAGRSRVWADWWRGGTENEEKKERIGISSHSYTDQKDAIKKVNNAAAISQHHAYKDLPRHDADVEHGVVAVGEISDDKEVFVLVRQALSLSSTLKISEIYIIAHVLLPNIYISKVSKKTSILWWQFLPGMFSPACGWSSGCTNRGACLVWICSILILLWEAGSGKERFLFRWRG